MSYIKVQNTIQVPCDAKLPKMGLKMHMVTMCIMVLWTLIYVKISDSKVRDLVGAVVRYFDSLTVRQGKRKVQELYCRTH